MSDYEDKTVRPNARLIILKALAAQTNESLHSGFIAAELAYLGIDRPRPWIHGELDWLDEMGAVTLIKADTVVVATLTEKGHRHLRRAMVIEGIDRPSRPGA
jgi:repressor of nif and glnA expression